MQECHDVACTRLRYSCFERQRRISRRLRVAMPAAIFIFDCTPRFRKGTHVFFYIFLANYSVRFADATAMLAHRSGRARQRLLGDAASITRPAWHIGEGVFLLCIRPRENRIKLRFRRVQGQEDRSFRPERHIANCMMTLRGAISIVLGRVRRSPCCALKRKAWLTRCGCGEVGLLGRNSIRSSKGLGDRVSPSRSYSAGRGFGLADIAQGFELG